MDRRCRSYRHRTSRQLHATVEFLPFWPPGFYKRVMYPPATFSMGFPDVAHDGPSIFKAHSISIVSRNLILADFSARGSPTSGDPARDKNRLRILAPAGVALRAWEAP